MDYGRYYESFYKIEKLKPPVTKNSILETTIPGVYAGFIEITDECNLDCTFCNKKK